MEAVDAVTEILCRLGRGAAVRPTRLLTDAGDELAARPDPESPFQVVAHVPDDVAAHDAVDSTERALWHLQAFGLGPVGPLSVRAVDDADWAESWRESYAPQRIGRVVIIPSWLDERPGPDEVPLRLDPGMAFGTGLHPSTRGCLTLLQRLRPMPSAVLDVGSGSGVLAIAALLLGAQRAVCLDTDPIAVEATQENAARNGLGERVDARLGTLPARAEERFPLICANLVAAVLIELSVPLAAHLAPGGTLIASGIVDARAADVEADLAAVGLDVSERLEDSGWVTLLARPAADAESAESSRAASGVG